MKRLGLALPLAALALAAGAAAFAWTAVPGRAPVPSLPQAVAPAEVHLPFGPVRPPRPLPAVRLVLDDGAAADLPGLTAGKWTLMQLMFAGCTTTCPIQGAIFQAAQADLAVAGADVRLLSVSVDPVGDGAASVRSWLDGFGAGPAWRAGVPAVEDLGPLLDVAGGRGAGVDVHDARVYLIDPEGRLVFVTEEMPDPRTLPALVLEAKAAAGS